MRPNPAQKALEIDILIPCYLDQFFPETGFNMIKVLEHAGFRVNYNPEQTCCGLPAFNAGFWDDAKEVGEKLINEYQRERYMVAPSGSCVGMVRNSYTHLFTNSMLHNQCKKLQKNLFEFSEFLVDIVKKDQLQLSFPARVTYTDACSALNGCGIKEAPRKLLNNIKGLKLVEMQEAGNCCGFGGMFSVKMEELSIQLAERKVQDALDTGADYIVSTDLGCLMHLDAYIKKNNKNIQVLHIADLMAKAIQ